MKNAKNYLLIGNSRWHWAIEDNSDLKYKHTLPDIRFFKSVNIRDLRWASVGSIPKEIHLNPINQLELKNIPLLNIPSWIGIDRALAALGALKKVQVLSIKSKYILVVDAGTIFSLTRVTNQGEFAGGQLLAGLRLQLSAMGQGALNLMDPGIDILTKEQFPSSTKDAMRRGSIQALIGTILEANRIEKMPIFLTGGDSLILYKELKKMERNLDIRHYPNLVMEAMVHVINNYQPN